MRRLVTAALLLLSLGPAEALPLGDSAPASQLATLAASMCLGCWADAGVVAGIGPNITLSNVFPTPPACTGGCAVGDPHAVMNAWSTAVLDTDRKQMLFWGGGHGDYCGNQVYAFQFSTLQFVRLTNPSTCDALNLGKYADGRPASVHSYDCLIYKPGKGTFTWAGSKYNDGGSSNRSFWFDPAALTWSENAQPWTGGGLLQCASGYDATNNLVYVTSALDNSCGQYNVATNTWTEVTASLSYPSAAQTTRLNPLTNVMWATGKGFMLSLAFPGCVLTDQTSTVTGDTTCQAWIGGFVGFDWYPSTSEFVCLIPADTNVYRFNPATKVWTKQAPNAANTVTPPTIDGSGLFGRWRWDAADGVFLYAPSTSQHVFVYKPAF